MRNLLDPEDRAKLLSDARPVRALPVFETKKRKYLPLAEPRPSDSEHAPIFAVWETTLRCDLACRHCGSRAGVARPDELSTEECLDLVHQLAELGTREVAIIGGEAYLRDDWVDIIREIKKSGMRPVMATGGGGRTAERARSGVEAGL